MNIYDLIPPTPATRIAAVVSGVTLIVTAGVTLIVTAGVTLIVTTIIVVVSIVIATSIAHIAVISSTAHVLFLNKNIKYLKLYFNYDNRKYQHLHCFFFKEPILPFIKCEFEIWIIIQCITRIIKNYQVEKSCIYI